MRFGIAVVMGFVVLMGAFCAAQETDVLVVRTPKAEYDETSGKIVAQDAVLSWRDLQVFCPTLEVDTKTQEVRTAGEIRVTFGTLEAHLERLLYSRATNTLSVSNIAGSAENLSFAAQEGHFDLTRGVAVFSGEPTLSVRGFVVRFREGEYIFATKTWRGQDVVVSREGWSGRAKVASYVEGTNLLVLEGDAEISRGGNRLRGERIVVNLDTLQVKVEGNVEIFLIPEAQR